MENTSNSPCPITQIDADIFSKTKLPRIILLGHGDSCKSEAVKTICHSMKGQYQQVFVHAISEPTSRFYETFIPSNCISSERNFDKLRKAYAQQRKRKTFYEAKVASSEMSMEEAQNECQMLIVLDDLDFLGDRVFYADVIKQIWMNGHHDWITVVVTLFSTEGVGPSIRNRSDWVVACHDPSVVSQKRLYMNWIGGFSSFRDFQETFNANAGADRFLVAWKSSSGKPSVESDIFSWTPVKVNGSFDFIQ